MSPQQKFLFSIYISNMGLQVSKTLKDAHASSLFYKQKSPREEAVMNINTIELAMALMH